MRTFYLYMLLFILIGGCIAENFSDTLNQSIVTPEYSLPLGSVEFDLGIDYYIYNSSYNPGGFLPIWYDDILYYVPAAITHTSSYMQFSANYFQSIEDHIQSITFHLLITNGFPTNGYAQIYTYNQAYVLLDSLSSDGPFYIQGTGKSNDSTSVNTQTVDLTLTQQQIANLTDAYYYTFTNTIETKGQGINITGFYSTQRIKITTGVRINVSTSTSDL